MSLTVPNNLKLPVPINMHCGYRGTSCDHGCGCERADEVTHGLNRNSDRESVTAALAVGNAGGDGTEGGGGAPAGARAGPDGPRPSAPRRHGPGHE